MYHAVRPLGLTGAALLAVAIAPLAACEDTDVAEMYECAYDENALAWSDAAPAHDSYDALLEAYGGTFDDALIAGNAGTVQIEKGAGAPILYVNTDGGCSDYTEFPIQVTLTQGDATATQTVPAQWSGNTIQVTAMVDTRDALATIKPAPELDANEKELGVDFILTISEPGVFEGRVQLFVEAKHGSGSNGTVSAGPKGWFLFSFDKNAAR